MGGRENEQGKGMRGYVGEMKREGGGGLTARMASLTI